LKSVYIYSSSPGSGKTSIAATLAKYLISKNNKVIFFKPVITGPGVSSSRRRDVEVMKQLLGMEETPELISPEYSDENSLTSNITNAFGRITSGKDSVLIEDEASDFNLAGKIAKLLDAKILGVEVFQDKISDILIRYKEMGKSPAGVIINKVPYSRLQQMKEIGAKSGVNITGVIPEDRSLIGPTVKALADGIGGNVINSNLQTQGVIENFLLGAMNPDHGPGYYARKMNKAVIVSSDRPDMQLSALETTTKCLVIAGQKTPIPMVLNRSETKQVPIISVNNSIPGILTSIESILSQPSLTKETIEQAVSIFEKNINLEHLCDELGLSV
jgi:BioD-like phosphotransacetylase family protein